MEVLVDRAAGLDVHKKSITACVLWTEGRTVRKVIARFETYHRGLERLKAWLLEHGVTDVCMEATGEYWKPVYETLEDSFTVVVANAQHVRNVPGRKTDPEDASWLARLLRHGLLRASFVPPKPIRQLRDQTRQRRKTVQLQSKVENRAQKILEASGVKLGSVVSDVFGATGKAILGRLAKNETDPIVLSNLAQRSLKKKKHEIALSLESNFTAHHAQLLRRQLDLHAQLGEQIGEIEASLETMVTEHGALIDRLDQIPGVNRIAAIEILGEIGTDMTPWAEDRFFAAWSGLCPGNHESAGRRKNVKARSGNPFLKSIMVQCATAAVRSKGTYYQSKFVRIAARRGYKRAIVAIAHSMLIAIYHMIKNNVDYKELGATFTEERTAEIAVRAHIRKLEKLGYSVSITPLSQPS